MMIRPLICAVVIASTLAACAQRPPLPLPTEAEFQRGCALSAADKLRALIGLNATDSRVYPHPKVAPDRRLVDLATVNAGQKVTYTFMCGSDGYGGFVVVPMGHD